MIIKGVKKSLKWNGRRLIELTGTTCEYNGEGIRTKKHSKWNNHFKLKGSNIIQMNKVTSNEDVILDFVYDSSSMLVGLNTVDENSCVIELFCERMKKICLIILLFKR